jgi:hypothetical protein
MAVGETGHKTSPPAIDSGQPIEFGLRRSKFNEPVSPDRNVTALYELVIVTFEDRAVLQ